MRLRNKLIVAFAICLLGLGGGYVAYRGYVHVRQIRLVRQARAFLDAGQERKALLCLQRALRYNSKDVEACRLMAQFAEAARSPNALLWRSRVVEANPHSLEDRLALAQTAMTFRDLATATNALAGVYAGDRNTVAYQNLAGAVAAAANQPAQAEAHFLEATQIEPLNALPQLNLAVVRLQSTNSQTLADARATLQRLSDNTTNTSLRCQALRELVVDALRYQQSDIALARSQELLRQTNSVFRDQLLRLQVLQDTRQAGFKSQLLTVQRQAAAGGTNIAQICDLATWQMAKTTPREALAWLQTLPGAARSNQAVAMVTAECQTIVQDWSGLQALLPKLDWGELEFVRHAYLARAQRGQNLTAAAKGEWELALKATQDRRGKLDRARAAMLLRLAAQWSWQNETEELLWLTVNNFPEDRRAVQVLSQMLFTAGNRTRALMTLYQLQMKKFPGDLAARNNLAMTALLLNAQELKPHELAREVYQKSPTNASYASTYAFSLFLQKKPAEALKVFAQLKPKDLEIPSVAGYYGLVLKATGDKAKAKVYLDWAFKAPMLDEERKLFEQARAGS
jgi:predicted Zn-dependent protease